VDLHDFILIVKYFILGAIQGIAEPIPISSSGHLIIGQRLLGIEQRGLSFEIITNTASLIAIVFLYRKDIKQLITHSFLYIKTRKESYRADFRFSLYVIIGTIPAGVVGVLFGDYIADYFTSFYTISITLLITGVALWIIRNMRGVKRDGDLSLKDAIIVGCAQVIALIPGISRSGSTVIASIGLGMKQSTALRFSFMLYIPVSVGGAILGVTDMINSPDMKTLALPYFIAFITALVFTYFSMKWLMGIMEKGNLKYFAYYCFIVGSILLVVAYFL